MYQYTTSLSHPSIIKIGHENALSQLSVHSESSTETHLAEMMTVSDDLKAVANCLLDMTKIAVKAAPAWVSHFQSLRQGEYSFSTGGIQDIQEAPLELALFLAQTYPESVTGFFEDEGVRDFDVVTFAQACKLKLWDDLFPRYREDLQDRFTESTLEGATLCFEAWRTAGGLAPSGDLLNQLSQLRSVDREQGHFGEDIISFQREEIINKMRDGFAEDMKLAKGLAEHNPFSYDIEVRDLNAYYAAPVLLTRENKKLAEILTTFDRDALHTRRSHKLKVVGNAINSILRAHLNKEFDAFAPQAMAYTEKARIRAEKAILLQQAIKLGKKY